jgi:hypothetical protein
MHDSLFSEKKYHAKSVAQISEERLLGNLREIQYRPGNVANQGGA